MHLILLLFLFLSCESEVKNTPKKEVRNWGNSQYDTYLSDAIDKYGSSLMTVKPDDWQEFTQVWPDNKEDLKRFWFNVIMEMAYWESNYKTDVKYQENFKDKNGNYIYSRGLLQLSIESGKGYDCPFKIESDIHNPKLNLECGVIILDRWVGRDKRIAGLEIGNWKGGARYWSVLRGISERGKLALKSIKGINQ